MAEILWTDLSKRSLALCADYLKRAPATPLLVFGRPNKQIRELARSLATDVFCLEPFEFTEDFTALFKTNAFEVELPIERDTVCSGRAPRYLWQTSILTADFNVRPKADFVFLKWS